MKAQLYTRYPLSSVAIYNGSTIVHFFLGAMGIAVGYQLSLWAYAFGALYFVLSTVELYLLMPLAVCPNCSYTRTANSRCVSGLNILSKAIAKPGDQRNLHKRAEGLLCPNNLYVASLTVPVGAIVPALILNFSVELLSILAAIIGLLLYRFFVIFPKIACVHCMAKYRCPQAAAMGVREL